jgi:hypothetical protein
MTVLAEDQSKEVTPDAVVQVNNTYGIVVEMKKHFDREKLKHFDQVKKYDADLVGWWTQNERLATNDLVLMTHYISKTAATDAYNEWMSNGNSYVRPFAIICFNYSTGSKEYFTLERAIGSLSDKIHDEDLRKVKAIPNDIIKKIISKYKFYDAPPPAIHTMVLLLDYVLPTLPKEAEFDKNSGQQSTRVQLTLDEAQDQLSHLCPQPTDSRDTKLPRREWVEVGLESLVECGIGEKVAGNPPKYVLRLLTAHRRKDTKEFLVERFMLKLKSDLSAGPGGGSNQGELFLLPPPTPSA